MQARGPSILRRFHSNFKGLITSVVKKPEITKVNEQVLIAPVFTSMDSHRAIQTDQTEHMQHVHRINESDQVNYEILEQPSLPETS